VEVCKGLRLQDWQIGIKKLKLGIREGRRETRLAEPIEACQRRAEIRAKIGRIGARDGFRGTIQVQS
jgi:hypothetical protein